jgi:hypothetical protein
MDEFPVYVVGLWGQLYEEFMSFPGQHIFTKTR